MPTPTAALTTHSSISHKCSKGLQLGLFGGQGNVDNYRVVGRTTTHVTTELLFFHPLRSNMGPNYKMCCPDERWNCGLGGSPVDLGHVRKKLPRPAHSLHRPVEPPTVLLRATASCCFCHMWTLPTTWLSRK